MAAVKTAQRGPGSRQHRRLSKTRGKLLEAARTLFAVKGMDLTTIDDITEKADVGKGTFYYHFTGKSQLIRALIGNMLGELETVIEERCRGCSNLHDLLDALIGAHIEFFSARWEDFALYIQGRADLTLQEGYVGIEPPYMNYLERVDQLLDSVLGRRLSETVLRRLTCTVLGLLSGYYSFAAVASQEDDIDAAFRSLRGAMVASLARFVQEAVTSSPGNTKTAAETA